jgi:hypothetical protein
LEAREALYGIDDADLLPSQQHLAREEGAVQRAE